MASPSAPDLAYVHVSAAGAGGLADLARGAAPFVTALAATLVPPRDACARVVDLACGTGQLAAPLVAAGHRVVGVDVSAATLAIARRKASGAKLVRASLYDVPRWRRALPEGQADLVLAMGEPLSYVSFAPAATAGARLPSLLRLFREIGRVVRVGGAFVFDVIVAAHGNGADRRTLTERSFVEGDGWTVLVSTREDEARGLVLRDITTFTRRGGAAISSWQRAHERHTARVLAVPDVVAMLADAGFTTRVRRAYGDHPLARRRRAFLCRRT